MVHGGGAMPVSTFNTKTFAVSEYQTFLKGIACFKGKVLVLDAAGLHVLDAGNDNGDAIACKVVSGFIDANEGLRKRSVDAWVDGEGSFSVGVETTDGNAYEYPTRHVPGTRNHKAQLGRGIKETWLKFSVFGTPFTLYRLRLGVNPGARKI